MSVPQATEGRGRPPGRCSARWLNHGVRGRRGARGARGGGAGRAGNGGAARPISSPSPSLLSQQPARPPGRARAGTCSDAGVLKREGGGVSRQTPAPSVLLSDDLPFSPPFPPPTSLSRSASVWSRRRLHLRRERSASLCVKYFHVFDPSPCLLLPPPPPQRSARGHTRQTRACVDERSRLELGANSAHATPPSHSPCVFSFFRRRARAPAPPPPPLPSLNLCAHDPALPHLPGRPGRRRRRRLVLRQSVWPRPAHVVPGDVPGAGQRDAVSVLQGERERRWGGGARERVREDGGAGMRAPDSTPRPPAHRSPLSPRATPPSLPPPPPSPDRGARHAGRPGPHAPVPGER